MNNQLLLLFEKHRDVLFEETRSCPQETHEYKLNEQMETFAFSPPINLAEKGKRLVAVSSFEATNFVFNITHQNKTLPIWRPGQWTPEGGGEIVDKLKKL